MKTPRKLFTDFLLILDGLPVTASANLMGLFEQLGSSSTLLTGSLRVDVFLSFPPCFRQALASNHLGDCQLPACQCDFHRVYANDFYAGFVCVCVCCIKVVFHFVKSFFSLLK